MRNTIVLLASVMILTSLASAQIIFDEQPASVYNLGETVNLPITIKPLQKTTGILEMNLVCQDNLINFYKNGVSVNAGVEKKLDAALILTKSNIQTLKGTCEIQATLASQQATSQSFTVSDLLTLNAGIEKTSLKPEEKILIQATLTKESGQETNGLVDISVYEKGNANPILTKIGTISESALEANLTIPRDMKAAQYTLTLSAYEQEISGQKTNQGQTSLPFSVEQVQKNLEILFEETTILPGESLKATIILHDQTGVNIPQSVDIEIKDEQGKLLEKKEVQTQTPFTFATQYNTPPETYTLKTSTNDLETQKDFEVEQNIDAAIEILNKTLVVKNTGNVEYCNKTVLVKIGNQALNIRPCLEVDEEEKYLLSAPEGIYDIEIISDEQAVKKSLALTGKAIDVKEINTRPQIRYFVLWITLIAILGIVAFMIHKKTFKKIFSAKKPSTQAPQKIQSLSPIAKKPKTDKLFNSNAQLSLSIHGEKQEATILNLKLKNVEELKKNPQGTKETIAKITALVTEKKGAIYENGEHIVMLLAPAKTKTFRNEKPALELAQQIKQILAHHNRLFKEKIAFSIAIVTGHIVVKLMGEHMQFTTFGNTLTQAKKIAALANKTILINETLRNTFANDVKVEKIQGTEINAYEVVSTKTHDIESEKFIKRFVERLEKK